MNLFAEQPEKIVYTLNRMAVPMVAQTKYRNTYGIDVYRRGCGRRLFDLPLENEDIL